MPLPVEPDPQRRFVYRGGAFVAAEAPDARRPRLLAADSWLVDDGRVRAIDLHRTRFIAAALDSGFSNEPLLAAFWQTALEAIPPIHRWFPRVELYAVASSVSSETPLAGAGAGAGAGAIDVGIDVPLDVVIDVPLDARLRPGERFELSLLMRIAPEPRATAVLATHGGADPRSIPNRKGPDLDTLTALRAVARTDGTDDLVILSPRRKPGSSLPAPEPLAARGLPAAAPAAVPVPAPAGLASWSQNPPQNPAARAHFDSTMTCRGAPEDGEGDEGDELGDAGGELGDGAIVEGTTTALLWWRGETLHAPAPELVRVDSVTARSLAVLARALGVQVVEEHATPADLAGAELWAVNALYGIRLVTEWRGGPTLDVSPAASAHAALWHRRLTSLARPLPVPAP
ncbi:aminotransferase class IV [Subtercola vilae]|uniref:aminotransferase class IV n=1 Tax=Subtercola vilae TaxID=2056433 RepID=UPI0010AA5113|nr:aminotransferase class IV [Subtercola vilae]